MNYTEEQVLNALRHVIEPDLKKDMVTLNMIADVEINGNTISFSVVLTTPACPLKESIKNACISAIHEYVDSNANVVVNLTSKVTSKRTQKHEVLKGVKNIIAVASGKGGVGKSTIAANLAVALSKTGAKTGLLDADIYGPSVPVMFGLEHTNPVVTEKNGKPVINPIEKFDLKILSIGFFIDPEKALIWRGPMASGALAQLITNADWGELDYLVIDMPPGTGDIHLTIVQTIPVTGVVIVSTPQKVALADARKGVNMFMQETINVPVLGLVENMSYFTPAELPDNKYYIFGKDGCKNLASELNIPLLGQIPITQSIRESGDSGSPVTLNNTEHVTLAFAELAAKVAQQVALRNATIEPTKVVEMNKS